MNKVGIELDVESGGFVSGIASAERSIESLTQAMKQAKEEGRDEDFVRLQIQRDTLSASTSGFKRDTQKLFSEPRLQTTTANGATVLKMDADQAMSFKDLNTSIKKLTSVYIDQINDKDFKGASETFSQLQLKQGEYKKKVEEATSPAGYAMQNSMKALVFGQIANSINEGAKLWVNSLDRSGIVNAYGSGDILGGRIAEKQRQADIWGGGAQAVLGTGGAVATVLGHPEIGVGLSALGQLINTLAHGPVNEEKTQAAFAGLWGQRSSDAMNLASLMGKDALIGDRNMVRESFQEAADAAAKFGYSAEEGMEMIGQAVKQGLNGDRAREVTEKVFNYERSTGADRGTLSSVANMAARYSLGDPLKAGWGGLHASGMSPGQYGEYLRGLQRILEDGISKGFTRASDQVTQNLTMIAQIGGDNKTWQGEGGARRYQSMSSGLENAVGLQSSGDIHVYRAARQILGEGASWVDVNRLVEQGLGGNKGTELQYRTWAMDYNVEGGGREGFVSRQIQRGQSYDAAIRMWDHFAPTFKAMGGDIDKALKVFESFGKNKLEEFKDKPLPNANGPELESQKTTQAITNWWTQTGQTYWDRKIPSTLGEEFRKAIIEFNKATGSNIPVPASTLPRAEQLEEELAPLGPIAHGMAVQADRIMANQEAAQLQRDIAMSRTSTNDYKLLWGGRGRGGGGNPAPNFTPFFDKTDANDQLAANMLTAYRDSDDPQAQRAFLQAIEIMKTFSDAEKTKANETNAINRAIPDVMTDKTGQQLLEELRNLKINIHIDQL